MCARKLMLKYRNNMKDAYITQCSYMKTLFSWKYHFGKFYFFYINLCDMSLLFYIMITYDNTLQFWKYLKQIQFYPFKNMIKVSFIIIEMILSAPNMTAMNECFRFYRVTKKQSNLLFLSEIIQPNLPKFAYNLFRERRARI